MNKLSTPDLQMVAIVGPTAAGKSAWAIRLAQRFNGVILSADSRQVYIGLDEITAKTPPDQREGIPHYLIDIVKPSEDFSVAKYQVEAYRVLDDIAATNRKSPTPLLPILVGGTGLYVAAVCDGYQLNPAPPNHDLRHQLSTHGLTQLQKIILDLNPNTSIDLNNPRRIIRAIEKAQNPAPEPPRSPKYSVLKIGIKKDPTEIRQQIRDRIKALDLEKILQEARLIKTESANKGPLSTYYQPALNYLEGAISREELLRAMETADYQYAKRQMTWFKKDEQIHWCSDFSEALRLVEEFIGVDKGGF